MSYTTAEARKELLESLGEAVDELGFASACLAEAYEQLDEQSGDRLEEAIFRPVQLAFGRAMRTRSEFASRYDLSVDGGEAPDPGLPSQGASGFIERGVEAAEAADHVLAELQDSGRPVEVGDEQLRDGLRGIREPLGEVQNGARGFLRGLGR
jgi:hypothetical protein